MASANGAHATNIANGSKPDFGVTIVADQPGREDKMLTFLRNEEQIVRLAKLLDAGGLLKKKGIQNPQMLFSVLAFGWDFGWGAWESVRNCHVIEGQISMATQTKMALAIKHGTRFEIKHSGVNGCDGRRGEWVEVTATRDGFPPVTVRWDDEDVKRAGLNRGPQCNHAKFPTKMKTWRAVSDACDYICPDLFTDIITPEEARESFDGNPRGMIPGESTASEWGPFDQSAPEPTIPLSSVVGLGKEHAEDAATIEDDQDPPFEEDPSPPPSPPPAHRSRPPKRDMAPNEGAAPPSPQMMAERVHRFFVRGLGLNLNSLETLIGVPVTDWASAASIEAWYIKAKAIESGELTVAQAFNPEEIEILGIE